jgi:hypothetical protein
MEKPTSDDDYEETAKMATAAAEELREMARREEEKGFPGIRDNFNKTADTMERLAKFIYENFVKQK